MTGDEGARLSGTEVQMLMQMMADIRSAVAGMDHKLDGMVPRPEFVQYQAATDRRFAALEQGIAQKHADHEKLHSEIEAVDRRVDTTREDVLAAESRVSKQIVASEKERHEGYRSLNTKAWFALVAAALAVVGGVIAQGFGA